MQNQEALLADSPILVTVARLMDAGAPLVECAYRGLVCVVDGQGSIVYQMGAHDTVTHMRSCAKPFQVMPLFEMGYFNNTKPEELADLALMMSSHSGAALHTSRVLALLKRHRLTKQHLRCGVHAPQDETERKELARTQTQPSELHNNCSGKHAGMLIACLQQGFALDSYESLTHPLQQWIKKSIATISDTPEHELRASVDGCSVPSWAMPIKNLALMYARMSAWLLHPAPNAMLKNASSLIWQAFTMHPECIAGPKRFDTELLRKSQGMLISKTGADGLHALSVRPSSMYPHGLGIVIKIADGDPRQRIRPFVIQWLLKKLRIPCDDQAFAPFVPSTVNLRQIVVSTLLDQLKEHG